MSGENKTRRNVLAGLASSAMAGLAFLISTDTTDTGPVSGPTSDDTSGRRNIIDVREYGAAVDGTTEDSRALARSIEAASPGGIVRIPPGDMLLDKRDALGAINLSDTDSDITITGSGPGQSRLVMQSGHSEPHILLQIISQDDQAAPNITIGNITLDGNKSEQIGGPGHGIRTSASGGHLTLYNSIIQNTWSEGIKLSGHMSANIRRCIFRNCGNPEIAGYHAIAPNQRSKQRTNISQCLFLNTAGADVDVGSDRAVNHQSCEIHHCYSEGSPRLLKIDPSNERTVVTNTKFVAGDGAVPSIGIVANNDTAECGILELDNVSISDTDGPGIDLGAGTNIDEGTLESLQLKDVAIQNVDNQNTRNIRGTSASGIYVEGTEFIQSGPLSIHNVGSDNMGDAVWLNQGCTGEIDVIRHAGTAELGRTADVTVKRNAAGKSPLEPDVPQKSQVDSWIDMRPLAPTRTLLSSRGYLFGLQDP